MAEQSSLSSILDDDKEPAPAPAATPEAPSEPAEPKGEQPDQPEPSKRKAWREKELNLQAEGAGMVRDPVTGQFVKKAEAPPPAEAPKAEPPPQPAVATAQPPAAEMTEKERAYLRAAQDERQKRQALEAELAKLRQPQGAPEQPKAFWDDPEGHLRRNEEVVRQERTTAKLETAELIARSRHADFDEKVAEFAELVKSTPGLAQQWLAAADPAEFAYVTGKNHLMLRQVGSLDALTEKVRRETETKVRAQVEAEYKAKQEALQKERDALPPSLSDSRGGAGAASRPIYNGPTPLEDILSGK